MVDSWQSLARGPKPAPLRRETVGAAAGDPALDPERLLGCWRPSPRTIRRSESRSPGCYLHGVGFVCMVLFGMTGMVATDVALRRNMAWRGYSAISVTAAVAVFFLFVLVFALEVATTLAVYGYFAVTVLWVEAMAPRLRRLT
jgi:hypothetical protein